MFPPITRVTNLNLFIKQLIINRSISGVLDNCWSNHLQKEQRRSAQGQLCNVTGYYAVSHICRGPALMAQPVDCRCRVNDNCFLSCDNLSRKLVFS